MATSGRVSNAVTQGIRVEVRARYVPEQSRAQSKRYVFAYTIRITNEGTAAAQLVNRHWVITDGAGEVEEVRGEGVVGEQPRLEPGQSFEYTSGCVLPTPRGAMEGTFEMTRDDGSRFGARVAPFALALPHTIN